MDNLPPNNDQIYNDGERYVPWLSGISRLEHYTRYYFALELVERKNVLDIACGEGYGSAILAKKSKKVVGVDVSPTVISHAKKKYSKLDNLSFKEGSTDQIPLNDNSVEVVVSFETLEHISQQDQMLSEIKRVLTKDGKLILSTPDKNNYLAESDFENKHHIKELSISELKKLVSKYFLKAAYYKQLVTLSSSIIPENLEDGGRLVIDREDPGFENRQLYNLVVASDHFISHIDGLAFHSVSEGRNVIMKEKEIYNSKTYKIGAILTAPYRLIRNVLTKK